MKYPADISDLKTLVCVLDALCTRVGIKVSYEGHSLGDIGGWWEKLHSTVVERIEAEKKDKMAIPLPHTLRH
jgi:hypothetical protein